MTKYHIAAVYATRVVDQVCHIGTSVGIVHPLFDDAQALGIACAQLSFPADEGWEDHHAFVQPLDQMITDTIIAEAGLAVPDHGAVATVVRPHRVELEIEDEP